MEEKVVNEANEDNWQFSENYANGATKATHATEASGAA